MRPIRPLNRLVYFAAVVEAGSFTAAARQLGVTKAVVSAQIARLEQETGATLLVRTTRRVHPTEAGRSFHARSAAILRDCEDAFEELEHATTAPKGHIRVTAPYDYGTMVVAPAAAAFSRNFPDCSVTLIVSDRVLDLLSEQIDLAVRVGWLEDSGLQTRKLGSFREMLVCGPALAETVSDIADPHQLEAQPWIINATHRDGLQRRFWRERDGECRDIRLRSTLMVDAAPAIRQAVIAGGGLAILPDFLVADDVAAGRLRHILPEWQLRDGGIHAVLPPARFRPARVRAFVETLARAVRDP